MSDKVAITVKSVTEIRQGSNREQIVIEAKGFKYDKENAQYITFVEEQEEGQVQTTIKLTDDEWKITRSGMIAMRQTFRLQETTNGTYDSPYGKFDLETKTHHFARQYNKHAKSGKLTLSYYLTISGDAAGYYTNTIMYQEVQS